MLVFALVSALLFGERWVMESFLFINLLVYAVLAYFLIGPAASAYFGHPKLPSSETIAAGDESAD